MAAHHALPHVAARFCPQLGMFVEFALASALPPLPAATCLPFPHPRCVVAIATPSSLYFFVLGAIRRRSVEHLIDLRYRPSRAFLEAALSLSSEARLLAAKSVAQQLSR